MSDDGYGEYVLLVIVVICFLPAIVASVRRHRQRLAIGVLNLLLSLPMLGGIILLGFKVLGWIISLGGIISPEELTARFDTGVLTVLLVVLLGLSMLGWILPSSGRAQLMLRLPVEQKTGSAAFGNRSWLLTLSWGLRRFFSLGSPRRPTVRRQCELLTRT